MESKLKRIGLIINDSYSDYEKELISGVAQCCKDFGYTLIIFSVGELNSYHYPYAFQKRSTASLAHINNVDGVVLASAVLGNYVSRKEFFSYINKAFNLPKVSIGLEIPEIPSIVVDQTRGLKLLIEELIKNQGCKKFGFIGIDSANEDGQIRTEVFKEVLTNYNIPFDENDFMLGRFTYNSADKAIERYVRKKGSFDFDAVVCLNDDMAFACMDYCKKNSISIPDKIKITGFDDVPKARFENPSLSTINQGISKQSYLGTKTLIDLLEGNDVPLTQTVYPEPVFRQSTGTVPLTDTKTNYIDSSGNKINFDITDFSESKTEWLSKRSQLFKLSHLHNSLQIKMTFAELRTSFYNLIKEFEICAAALVLYDTPISLKEPFLYFPLPDSAIVFTSFDESIGYFQNAEEDYIHFNPREKLLPSRVLNLSKTKLNIYPLSECDLQFGYIIYEFGTFEELIYEMMNSMFSHLVSTAYENSRIEHVNTQLKKENESLSKISITDELTGLLNRRGFINLGQQTIDISLTLKKQGLVIFGDMDGLKKINDTYGHEAGDKAIKAEATILKNNFRCTDIIGRLGGDEFAIIAPNLTIRIFERIREKIEEDCKKWNIESNEKFSLSISLGYADFSSADFNLPDILKSADEILYMEKKRKKGLSQ